MTIAEVIAKLRQEREVGSRYPARMIFVEDLTLYTSLVTQLKSACDVTINLADLANKDVVPQFDKLRDTLEQYENKQVLLLSVGEYLRMCIKRELNRDRAQFPAFWELMQQESLHTRYIMPMFACRDSFDRIIGKIDERQEDFVWTLEKENSPSKTSSTTTRHSPNKQHQAGPRHYNITVYSPKFAESINADAENFQAWLRNWDAILSKNLSCTIITNQYRNAEASLGTISLKPIDCPFAYLSNLLKDAVCIEQAWEPDDFWTKLIPAVKQDMTFADVVLDQLGIISFDFVSVIARWESLTSTQRELVWMWYRAYPTEEYYSYACKKARKAVEIPERIRDEILLISSRSQNWINERMAAMQVLGFTTFDDAYFKALDKLAVAEMKLQLLTYKTHEECAFAVKTISNMLRSGAEPEAAAGLLKSSYPVLATYMSESSGIDSEIDEYLSWYRKNKLINRFPGNYAKHISYDRFDARLKQLNKLSDKDCFTFWIDGFGVEWLPVFLKELELRGIRPESKSIATAKLPTETEYNHQWDENDPLAEKWGRLDSYSHKGMPDDKSYYSCIVYQLSVFKDAAKEVDDLLKEHEYVAITGDHGSSRLAALAFHDSRITPCAPPLHSKVRSYGRFCELEDNADSFVGLDFEKKVTLNGKTYVVMKDYNQFSIGGNAAGGNNDDNDVVGEIHGGDTPEERLVPVVVVKRSQPLPPITCKPKSKFVTKRNGHVETELTFSRKAYSLEVSIDSITGNCTEKTDGTWIVSFDGITGEELPLSVVVNGNLLSEKILLKVKSQGINKNAGMGGLP